jgi:DNA-binding response OmpR family regulator
MRVLYLEDSEPDVRLIRQYMTSVNYQFAATDTLDEARNYLQQQRPDLFLVDIMIHGECSDELIAMVAKQKLSKYIVAVTAKALPTERKHYLELGCNHVIAKPFTIDDLENTLSLIQL